MPEPYILCLESCAMPSSAAVFAGNKMISLAVVHQSNSHARTLTILAEQAMKNAGISYSELSAVAVSEGPGSYTGLRIGYSTAKGICFSHDIPLISVPTLAALATEALPFAGPDALVCPMIDARRMEVYCGLYRTGENGFPEEVMPVQAVVVTPEFFASYLENNKIIFIGDGSAKCRAILGHFTNAVITDTVFPSAFQTGRLAAVMYAQGRFADLAYSEPFYLKEANTGNKPAARGVFRQV
ncbi:MAG: tRNA (adenosine(37)-N6)-threonylcarbamoyltransferase complex dimerization subunit type 1 TsaB [Bacteroidota bacterium]